MYASAQLHSNSIIRGTAARKDLYWLNTWSKKSCHRSIWLLITITINEIRALEGAFI